MDFLESRECYLKPAPGETLEATVTLPQGEAALVTGQVLNPDGDPQEGVLVLLLEQESRTIQSYTTTDPNGQFFLPPVPSDRLYVLHLQPPSPQPRLLTV
jgi:hypothetical protein